MLVTEGSTVVGRCHSGKSSVEASLRERLDLRLDIRKDPARWRCKGGKAFWERELQVQSLGPIVQRSTIYGHQFSDNAKCTSLEWSIGSTERLLKVVAVIILWGYLVRNSYLRLQSQTFTQAALNDNYGTMLKFWFWGIWIVALPIISSAITNQLHHHSSSFLPLL